MNCQELGRILDEQELRWLPAAERGAAEAHLASCPDCARDHQLDLRLAALPIPPLAPQSLASWRALANSKVIGRSGQVRNRFIVIGAVVAVAAAAAMLALQRNRTLTPAAATAIPLLEPSVETGFSGTLVLPARVALAPSALTSDDESKAMEDWTQRVAEWLAVRDDPDALLTAALLLQSKHAGQKAELLRRAAMLAPDSARIQATAMVLCYAPCDSTPYEQAVRRLAPDNALGWVGEANRALRADDNRALQRTLTAMSRARTFDTYEGATMLAMTSQMRAALVPPLDIKGYVPAMAAIHAFSAMPIPAYLPVTKTCKSAEEEGVLLECRQIGAAMRAGDTVLTNALGFTLGGYGLPADSAEAGSLAQQSVQFKWITLRASTAFERQDDPEGYLSAFVDHPREIDAWRAFLEARNIPTEPPAGWKPQGK